MEHPLSHTGSSSARVPTGSGRPVAPSPRRPVAVSETIGWRGVSLRVPEDWTLTKVSKEGESGYLRADSLDGLFVQIKWSEKKGLVSIPDSFDNYTRDLQKNARKHRQQIEFKTKPRALVGIHRAEDAPLTYT